METVIVDAGPLVAHLRADDQDHDWTAARFQQLTPQLLSCDAALGEAFFLLREIHGGTLRLLEPLDRALVIPAFDLASELRPVGQLLRRYNDVPMSLADACLVRMSELRPDATVFTLDSDFRIYRKNRRQSIPLLMPE